MKKALKKTCRALMNKENNYWRIYLLWRAGHVKERSFFIGKWPYFLWWCLIMDDKIFKSYYTPFKWEMKECSHCSVMRWQNKLGFYNSNIICKKNPLYFILAYKDKFTSNGKLFVLHILKVNIWTQGET